MLPSDSDAHGNTRGAVEWAHEGTRSDWLSYSARVQRVSDSSYWKDFPNQLPALTQRLLPTDLSGTRRFLPFAACHTSSEEIAVASALMLLEDVAFYTERRVSFRSLLDGRVQGGELHDLSFDGTGLVTTLEIELDEETKWIPAAGALVVPTRQFVSIM